MASTKINGFNYGQYDFHEKQKLSLKGMASTTRNSFHWKEWFPLKWMASNKGMSSIKRIDFH